MILTAAFRFRDALRKVVPVWLSDRPGLNVAFRYAWALVAPLDDGLEFIFEGVQAAWPGVGDSSALPYIGRTRDIMQGFAETNAHYAARLLPWLETHAAGRTVGLAKQLHEVLANNPQVRIITRSKPNAVPPVLPHWVTVATDGTVTETDAAFDWDSISNPERVNNWSEMWIIIYPTSYAQRAGTLGGLTGDDGYGLGQMVPHADADAVRTLIARWRGAHAMVRAIVWTTDSTLFNPAVPASNPDGKWGEWCLPGSDPRVAGSRNLASCRFWEPN